MQVFVEGTDTTTESAPFETSRQSVDFRDETQAPDSKRPSTRVSERQEFLMEMMGTQVNHQDLTSNTVPVPSPSRKIIRSSSEKSVILSSNSEQVIQGINKDIEILSIDQLESVQVIASCMEKRYPNGKVAVKDFSLAMLEGQITCLLGTMVSVNDNFS